MAPTSWFVPRPGALKWRAWDASFVVFDPASGDTHFLNGLAGAVLKLLESGPASFEDVIRALENASDGPIDIDLHEDIRALIDKLDGVGLIERVRP